MERRVEEKLVDLHTSRRREGLGAGTSGIDSHTSLGSQIDPKKMEQVLNEWLEKIEEQVNIIEDKTNAKATGLDLQ